MSRTLSLIVSETQDSSVESKTIHCSSSLREPVAFCRKNNVRNVKELGHSLLSENRVILVSVISSPHTLVTHNDL